MTTKSIQLNSAMRRAGLPVAAVACLALAVFALKWYLANAASANADQPEIAEAAVLLAPEDPQSHYALAVLREKSFLLEDVPRALESFERATALSPHDYRLWFALGRARDRSGDRDGAQRALRRALELAPGYAQVQWALGNVLLRQGKNEEAVSEIRRAVEGDKNLAAPAVTSLWQVFEGDVARISRSLGDAPPVKAALAGFLAREKRFDEAFRIWNELPAADQRTVYKPAGEELFNALVAGKKFAAARQLQAQISENGTTAPEKFTNGGFEAPLNPENKNIFDWQIEAGAQPLVGLNNEQKRGGGQSLFFIFNSPTGKDFRQLSQTIVVAPNQSYTFQAFYRSELKTTAAAAALKWEIVDAGSEKVLAATEAVAANADWSPLTAKFTTGSETEAVRVRLARGGCASAVCPISGKIWFDDFSLEK